MRETRTAAVVRGGVELLVPAEGVVPGDLLLLRAGDRVAADARVVAATSLELDESVLTGESLPVAKQPDPVPVDSALADRSSMVYAATAVAQGTGRALVTATGGETEVGLVDRLAASTFVGEVVMRQAVTPLLHAARARGCATQAGTDMLFEQIPLYLEYFGFPAASAAELRAVARLDGTFGDNPAT